MKRLKIILILAAISVFFSSFASAEIIINQQPNAVYNLGDVINIPVTIKTLTDFSGTANMDLICGGQDINFYKNGRSMSAGDEIKIDSSLVLKNSVIGTLTGNCRIKIGLDNGEYNLTNQFKISNIIAITKTSSQIQFNPGDYFFVSGNATRESGSGADGFIDLQIMGIDNSSAIENLGTINSGYYSMNLSLPKDMKAGSYLVKLNAYEEDSQTKLKTNTGDYTFNIAINQVPTSLEILFENKNVQPGTDMKVEAVLHDQSGEKMDSTVYITVKDSKDKIFEQTQINTGEFVDFSVPYNVPPSEWKVFAVSNKLTSESDFSILANEKVKIDLVNRTVIVTNTGNVPYNNTIVVKIGDNPVPLDVYLNVGETKKFWMTAPEGGYDITITTPDGQSITGMAVLTGKSINVTTSGSEGIISFIKQPFVWIFVIFVLGAFLIMIFSKIRKKSFFGSVSDRSERIKESRKPLLIEENGTIKPVSNKAELSLSIRGEKQDSSIVCIKIRNFGEYSGKSDVRESLGKINDSADSKKAVLYESGDSLFYVFAPMRTRTFENEQEALKLARESLDILSSHNKIYKHKLDFGISLNFGAIVGRQENTLKIMGIGNTIINAKKIASLAKEELLVSEEMNPKISKFAKTDMEMRGTSKVYKIREMRSGGENYKDFIDNFTKKMKSENADGF